MDIRCASGSRSTHHLGGVPCWSVRGQSPGRASHCSVRTLSRRAHQQGRRSCDCHGSTTTCVGGESVLRGRGWLERHRDDTSVSETILANQRALIYSLPEALISA